MHEKEGKWFFLGQSGRELYKLRKTKKDFFFLSQRIFFFICQTWKTPGLYKWTGNFKINSSTPIKNKSYYFLRSKFYDVLDISHILKNAINIVWKIYIMSCFTKLSLINNMGKINVRIERRESNK